MERESFEDPATAALMNEHFVSIKVDREERPDLDAIYMDAVQAMTGSGGWPMTVFLSPGRRAVLRGHVLPEGGPRTGCRRSAECCWASLRRGRDQREVTDEQGRRVLQVIARAAELAPSDDALDESVLRGALEALRESFDPEWGGFGGAPKFPQPMTLEFLLRCTGSGVGGRAARCSPSRSTAWRAAASTTTSAAGSIGTRRTRAGTSRTSRRCSTTTRSSRACTRTRTR